MIDPITIGVAFATAQGAVKHIKDAIALGKDVKGLIGQFSQFYMSADQVHAASTKKKIESIKKSNSQINKEALEMAMASKALRDYERELKDILYMTGNADVWLEMMAERTRMYKERAAMEKAEEDRAQRDREAKAEFFMNTMWFIAGIGVVVPVISLTWHVIVNRGF